MNEYRMEMLLEQERKEKEIQDHIEEMMEDWLHDEDGCPWDDIHGEDWNDMFDGYFYEDPMEKAMHEVGMSWNDFI